MTALVITAANVIPGSGAIIDRGRYAGGALTRGQCVRLSSGTYVAADNTSSANAAAVGIALNDATTGQPVDVQTGGLITIGAAVVIKPYMVGAGAGAIIPCDDLAGGGEFGTLVGMAVSATQIDLRFSASGAAAAAVT